jgi:hypothetical protein
MESITKHSFRFVFLLLVTTLFLFSGCGDFGSDDDDSNTPAESSNCSADQREYKPVDFHNTWQPNVTVRVSEYDLTCDDIDFQDPSDVAFELGSPGSDPDAHLLLPQGSYSICIDWWDTNDSTYYHNFYGSLPDDPFFSLNENSNETVPLEKMVEADYNDVYPGRCPAPVDINVDSSGNTPNNNNGSGSGDTTGFVINLIGNHGETAIYQPNKQQIDDADVSISGSLSSLSISWKLQNVISVSLVDSSLTPLYVINGENDGAGGNYIIASPVQYGDYLVPNTESGGTVPSPALSAETLYTITIATSDKKSAYLQFKYSN